MSHTRTAPSPEAKTRGDRVSRRARRDRDSKRIDRSEAYTDRRDGGRQWSTGSTVRAV